MNVNLSSTFEDYIKQQLDTGTYNNASEVVREALRLKMQQDELYQAKVEAMRLALIAGEQSGKATPLNIQDVIKKAKTKQGLNA
ncbi:MAG: type II toxin-antitoxin system ParD family antitoxin [Gammaproteobacteria bacterium]|nr:type II toxin-antitoxin system ParD family antitoxin [Gammaproteobacteria bacterium]